MIDSAIRQAITGMACVWDGEVFDPHLFVSSKFPMLEDEVSRVAMSDIVKTGHDCYWSEMTKRGLSLQFDLTPFDLLDKRPHQDIS